MNAFCMGPRTSIMIQSIELKTARVNEPMGLNVSADLVKKSARIIIP